MRTNRARYQQGSITKVERLKGYAWEVRFSEWVGGKRKQRTLTFDGVQYPKEKDVRKAIELTVSQVNSGTAGEKADAKFRAIITLYRSKYLPTDKEIEALQEGQEPELQYSTRKLQEYLFNHYIEGKLGHLPLREVRPLLIQQWLDGMKLAATTKASIRSLLSGCFRLAALHEFIPASEVNPMTLIKLKGVTKRLRPIEEVTIGQFRAILNDLPPVLRMMVLFDGALGLRISELLALKWADIDFKKKQVVIQRKFTRGRVGKTKTVGSEAVLPLADALVAELLGWKPETDNSEWLFPSPRTGGPRSASMLLQKGLKPVALKHGVERITWHTLRHACRSWLSSGGAAVGTQKDLLRQADISTTMNIYGHALKEDMRKAHDNLVEKLLDDQAAASS